MARRIIQAVLEPSDEPFDPAKRYLTFKFYDADRNAAGPGGPPGPQGEKGDPGEDGAPGADGVDGAPGTDGADGAPGASAYEVWLAAGNSGTVNDYLASLKGPKGDTGETGPKGDTGAAGPKGDTGAAGAPSVPGAWNAVGAGQPTVFAAGISQYNAAQDPLNNTPVRYRKTLDRLEFTGLIITTAAITGTTLLFTIPPNIDMRPATARRVGGMYIETAAGVRGVCRVDVNQTGAVNLLPITPSASAQTPIPAGALISLDGLAVPLS